MRDKQLRPVGLGVGDRVEWVRKGTVIGFEATLRGLENVIVEWDETSTSAREIKVVSYENAGNLKLIMPIVCLPELLEPPDPIKHPWAMNPDKPAVKYDMDKPRFDLIPAHPLTEVASVFSYGARKYADRNWEKGMSWCRIFAAMMRHSWAWLGGQTYDPETGLHRMAHAAFGCLALIEYEHTKAGKDDRPIVDKHAKGEFCD